MTVTLRFAAGTTCAWTPPPDVEMRERSDFELVARMPRGRVKGYLNEALAACEVADVRIAEEDMGDLVEKVYTLEGSLPPGAGAAVR